MLQFKGQAARSKAYLAILVVAATACDEQASEVDNGGRADSGLADAASTNVATPADSATSSHSPAVPGNDSGATAAHTAVDAGKGNVSSVAHPSYPCQTGWPMPYPSGPSSPNATSYSEQPIGVITDAVTGLAWATKIERFFDVTEALAYCEALSFGSFEDWRLPKFVELASLIDYSQQARPFYNPAFPRFPPENGALVSTHYFWSSSTGPKGTWIVGFDGGDLSRSGNSYDRKMASASLHTMCVRTAVDKMPPTDNCYDKSDDTQSDYGGTWPTVFTNRASKLSWHHPSGNKPYAATKKYCEEYGVKGTWRIPTTAEFSTLIAEAQESTFDVFSKSLSPWIASPFPNSSLYTYSSTDARTSSYDQNAMSNVLCVSYKP